MTTDEVIDAVRTELYPRDAIPMKSTLAPFYTLHLTPVEWATMQAAFDRLFVELATTRGALQPVGSVQPSGGAVHYAKTAWDRVRLKMKPPN